MRARVASLAIVGFGILASCNAIFGLDEVTPLEGTSGAAGSATDGGGGVSDGGDASGGAVGGAGGDAGSSTTAAGGGGGEDPCGNGFIDPGETCDGDCITPFECFDADLCTARLASRVVSISKPAQATIRRARLRRERA